MGGLATALAPAPPLLDVHGCVAVCGWRYGGGGGGIKRSATARGRVREGRAKREDEGGFQNLQDISKSTD